MVQEEQLQQNKDSGWCDLEFDMIKGTERSAANNYTRVSEVGARK